MMSDWKRHSSEATVCRVAGSCLEVGVPMPTRLIPVALVSCGSFNQRLLMGHKRKGHRVHRLLIH